MWFALAKWLHDLITDLLFRCLRSSNSFKSVLSIIMASNEAEVIIVGGGPVGLSLACDLSNRGVKTILLERSKTTSVIAKAFALNSRSLEHFRRMGVQEKIENASLPRDFPVSVGIYSGAAAGSVEMKATFSSWGDIADGKQNKGYPFYEEGTSPVIPMFCAQCSSEPVLKKHIETTSDCVQLLFGHRAVSISQDENGVIVEAFVDEIETKIFKGQYLVACDGGSSPSRKLLGAHLYGKFVLARAVSVMFNSPQMFEQIKNDSKIGLFFIVNKSYAALSYVVNDKGDIVVHIVLAPNTSDAVIAEYVNNPERTVKTVFGYSCPLKISASSSYQMHALLSTKSRIGRVIFAGDSAHQWLPAGGLGLNTGISDVGELGWKLEAAVKRFGGINILDSYEEERRPLVDMIRQYAYKLGGNVLVNTRNISMVLSIPIVRSVISWAVVRFILPRLFESNLLTLGFQYSNSSIIMHEYNKYGEIVTPSSYNGCRYPTLPGCRAPHVRLSDHESILDLFGKGFIILDIGGVDTDLQDLKEELKKRNVPYQQICLSKSPELVGAYDRKYFLVRPDGIICWRSDSQPSSLESAKIVATVIGDNPRQRLPLPITRLPVPITQIIGPSILRLFVSDIILRFGFYMVLRNVFHVSHVGSCLFSSGLLVVYRALMVKQLPQFIQETSRHSAIVIEKFGEAESVLTVNTRHTGSFGPRDILIRVHAASINPIDCQIRKGHGSFLLRKLLSPFRKSFFPLVLGRDCAGEVVAVGDAVTKFFPGDFVIAAVPIHEQGTHAQLVSVKEDFVFFKPSNVSFNEAASLPWVTCSAWNALVKSANLNQDNCRGKKVFIHAEMEGVGIFAVQMLKAWGADVTVMCSTQSVTLARLLDADNVIDYVATKFSSTGLGNFDVILDVSGMDSKCCILKSSCNGKYVSLRSPDMLLSQKFGFFIGGLIFSWMYRFKVIVNRILFQRSFFFTSSVPDAECLAVMKKMVEKGEIRPMIEAVYSMDEIIAAHKHVEAGCSRGQIVVAIP